MKYSKGWTTWEGIGDEVFFAPKGGEGKFPEVSIETYSTDNTNISTLENSYPDIKTRENVVIAQTSAVKISGDSTLADKTPWHFVRLIFQKGSKIYLVGADNAEDVLNQTLSTFRFIE